MLLFLIIWLGAQIDFVFQPLVVAFRTLVGPLLIAGVLFFLLRPPMQFLVKRKVPKSLAILLLYFVAAGALALLALSVGPMIKTQFAQLIAGLPIFVERAVAVGYELARSEAFAVWLHRLNLDVESIASTASGYAMTLVDLVTSNLTNVLGAVANAFLLAVIVPFVLYFLLKDGDKMFEGFIGLFPKTRQADARKLLSEMDRTIGFFIRGQMTVAVCVGLLLLVGFQIIGLRYAVLLAFIAMVTNVIPYLGAFLSAAPAVLVGLAQSPDMALKVLIVTVVAQQLEGNLLSPWIMGKGLNIHPLTIILLLLVVGSLFGPIGLLFAIPGYAVSKVVAVHMYRFVRQRSDDEEKPVA
ncbi:AI-2E family transporter [Paenibacillus sp.]|uniref:AI-2E family transporter n=1 Tax=Paenibacillus sp. TaxID=58172 RepID=UPI002810A31C|nr:AI-2E family transporter [Paenibacillus sp.]